MSWLAGVDVGGTFTDIILINTKTREIRVGKTPSTARDQSEGFLSGLQSIGDLAEVEAIVHGTTVGTNAILERKGARTGLITSKGFRDVIELGRRTRPNDYGMTGSFAPLIERRDRREVAERLNAEGEVLTPLDREGLADIVRELAEDGVESLAVMLLHSYSNPDHEIAAEEEIRALWPNEFISLSHRVLPEVGEFERASSTAINAYLEPLLHRYVMRVDEKLKGVGYKRSFRIMQSNGGALNADNASRNAGRSVLSGPAGGAIATAWIARHLGITHAVSGDMGGTSFDVSVILDGEPALAEEKEIAYGIPSRIPMIDIETIGAGGGSLVYLDDVGILHVGPQSAGSEPGPICYGRGGTRATIADANALLGRLPVANFIDDGNSRLDEVFRAFEEIGRHLDCDAYGAAEAALRVADLNMAGAIRKITLEKGLDPRQFSMLPFGGAGPLHACAIADNLGIPRVLLPIWPGVTSALGCLLADIRYDDSWSVHERIDRVDPDMIRNRFGVMIGRVMAVMESDGVAACDVSLKYEIALQYEGQTHRVFIEVPDDNLDPAAIAELFVAEYRNRYGVSVDSVPMIVVLLRVSAVASRNVSNAIVEFLREAAARHSSKPAEPTGHARMMFGNVWSDTPVYRRESLGSGQEIKGPARLDQADTTTVVPPGWTAVCDALGYVMISKEGAAE